MCITNNNKVERVIDMIKGTSFHLMAYHNFLYIQFSQINSGRSKNTHICIREKIDVRISYLRLSID